MNGTIYTDLTGAFPVTSVRGNKLLYIAYSYDANGWGNDFGFKYTNKQHVDELLKIMLLWYVMKMDWPGTSFGGIKLKWNYDG